MTEPLKTQHGSGRRCLCGLAAAAIGMALLEVAAQAQNRPAGPVAVTAPAAAVPAVKPPPAPKTPRQLAEEILSILRPRQTPWQLYGGYAQSFQDYAQKEKGTKPATDRATAAQARMVAQLQGMADLLTRMGEQAKLRQSIQHGTSAVPPEKRQVTFVQAGAELDRLLAEFGRLAAELPRGRATAPAGS